MKRIFLLLMSVVACSIASMAQEARELGVLTYNIRFGELSDMAKLAEEITSFNPDFVALQEVDVNTNRALAKHNNGLNFISELAQRTGYFGYYGRAIDFGGGYYGIGILSRYPAEKIEKTELPNPGSVEPRVLLTGVFELPGQKKMVFACTHFDYSHQETRISQARTLVDVLTGYEYPVIVAGDFNANATHPGVKLIKEHMKDLTNDRLTWPADVPKEKIDFIFGYPAEKVELKSCFVPEPSTSALSDHLPIFSEITVMF